MCIAPCLLAAQACTLRNEIKFCEHQIALGLKSTYEGVLHC
jgi:hypothetical protein